MGLRWIKKQDMVLPTEEYLRLVEAEKLGNGYKNIAIVRQARIAELREMVEEKQQVIYDANYKNVAKHYQIKELVSKRRRLREYIVFLHNMLSIRRKTIAAILEQLEKAKNDTHKTTYLRRIEKIIKEGFDV